MDRTEAHALVAVIMPYYGQPQFLLDAVRSVEAQTYPAVELIVVDDASPEPSAEDLVGWRDCHNWKLIRHETNKGKGAARNTAIAATQAELILPLDADDLIAPEYLERTVPVLRDPSVAAVYTDVKMFGCANAVWSPDCSLPACLTQGVPTTFLYRRQMFELLGGYKTHLRYGPDKDFWLAALQAGCRIEHLQEPLYLYRAHPGGDSSKPQYAERLTSGILGEHRHLYAQYVDDVLALSAANLFRRRQEYRRLQEDHARLADLSRQYAQRAAISPREPRRS